jgi:MnmE helical domain/GTP-binding protein TrmE N-terminus
MRAPASFTGEDVAELHGHGGAHNLERLLAAVIERGARIAEPGEFTRRAVASGKLDLLRAEALLEVIHAGSERAWRLAQANLGGRLGEEVAGLERRALAVLAEIEGAIDFPDEDLELDAGDEVDREIAALGTACGRLAEGFRHGRAVTQGVTVALVGAVNVGTASSRSSRPANQSRSSRSSADSRTASTGRFRKGAGARSSRSAARSPTFGPRIEHLAGHSSDQEQKNPETEPVRGRQAGGRWPKRPVSCRAGSAGWTAARRSRAGPPSTGTTGSPDPVPHQIRVSEARRVPARPGAGVRWRHGAACDAPAVRDRPG